MKTKSQNQNLRAQNRPEQLSTAAECAKAEQTPQRPPINFRLRRFNRRLNAEKLLALLQKEAPDFFALAEVVGKWAWIHFTEKQFSQIITLLSEFGFHWNNARQTWQHPLRNLSREPRGLRPAQALRKLFRRC